MGPRWRHPLLSYKNPDSRLALHGRKRLEDSSLGKLNKRRKTYKSSQLETCPQINGGTLTDHTTQSLHSVHTQPSPPVVSHPILTYQLGSPVRKEPTLTASHQIRLKKELWGVEENRRNVVQNERSYCTHQTRGCCDEGPCLGSLRWWAEQTNCTMRTTAGHTG